MMCTDRWPRSLLHLPASVAGAVREQADREEFARIDARLEGGGPTDISHELMSRHSGGYALRADPYDRLELLWRLPAKS